MIAVGSCGHNCDDERIYYKQIHTLIENGYQIQYFSYSKKSYVDDYNDNIKYRFFNSTEISQKQYKTILFNLLKNNPPKIFHIHDMELLPVAAKLKKKYPQVKIIYDVHEDLEAMWDTFSSYNGVIKWIINYILTQYEKKFLPYVDYFILANRLARTKKYSSHANVEIIENFPVLEISNEEINKEDPYKLIYHGQFGEDRGILTLINAFNILSEKNDNLELTLIGSARTEKLNEVLMQKIKENKKIQLINQVPHKQIWGYLNDAHIGIIPFYDKTIFQYNTPTKLFEYMISDCAIIASELQPIKEFCNESISWAKPGDVDSLVKAINYYFDNHNQYVNHKKNNHAIIQSEYNWGHAAQKLLNIYNEMLN